MFKRTVVTESVIHAPPGEVWEVLTSIAEFSVSNSTFGMTSADFREGGEARLTLRIHPDREFAVTVTFQTVEPNRELRWYGGIPGVGGGSHFFRLEPHGEGWTMLTHGEDLMGVLSLVAWPFLRRSMLDRYQQTTDEIREYCEKRRMA